MLIIPAIDIMSGGVVRLIKGDPGRRVSYASDPLEIAVGFSREGAEYLHIIDLDAALGRGDNKATVRGIIDVIEATVQVGGGLRSLDASRALLDYGVDRVVLGSYAFDNPEEASKLMDEYGSERVVVSMDHREGLIHVKGWRESTGMTLTAAIDKFSDLGFCLFLVTNIERDGTLMGPDVETLLEMPQAVQVMVSGGVSSLRDLFSLRAAGAKAVVVGRALYEGRFTLREARRFLEAV